MKNKFIDFFWFLFCSVFILLVENFVFVKEQLPSFLWIISIVLFTLAFLLLNAHPLPFNKIQDSKLHHCAGGLFLLKVFLFTALIISLLFLLFPLYAPANFIKNPDVSFENQSYIMKAIGFYGIPGLLVIYFMELILFWNGILRVYFFSRQTGIKLKVIGLICGMIPIANLIVLFIIIRKVDREIFLESAKEKLNLSRKNLQICKTKYPILLVHGVFFRDLRFFNYWGRIPGELEKNGATIYYGNQESANSVKNTAEQLAKRIKEILQESGAEKVNIIAHSKGGLDSRYMISMCGMEDYVASLTTVNTPHRGCEFADYLLSRTFSEKQKEVVASAYNSALKKIGDKEPDFISAVTDLTSSACKSLNEKIKDSPKVYYQSFGSILKKPQSGTFPLNFSYRLVKKFDGPNDGLVGEKSFEWGKKYTMLQTSGKRGISHGDVIDLNRENIPGFDVREIFVNLVSELRKMGF